MNKVVRNGKVAILYSPGYGAGWYTWNTNYPESIFLPRIIELVEKGEHDKIDKDLMFLLLGKEGQLKEDFYYCCGGAENLKIKWLEENTHFDINEYDGYESIVTSENIKLIA